MEPGVDLDVLVADWTLLDDEWPLVARKRGGSRLVFALLLKSYGRHGRFLSGPETVSAEIVDFVARRVGVSASSLAGYDWLGRTHRYHQAQIREYFGYRACSVADAEDLTAWLASAVCERERDAGRVRAELLARCRAERIEPPSDGRVDRIVRSALHQAETTMTVRIATQLSVGVRARLDALLAADAEDEHDESVLTLVKSVPGNVSLESLLVEIDKLHAVRRIDVPSVVFADTAAPVLAAWRSRASVEAPSHLRTHGDALRWTLLAALLATREREILDALVDLLIATVHRINARADRKVTAQLTNVVKKVTNKEHIFFSIAEAALDAPDRAVREVVFPAVSGGEATLRDVVREYKATGPTYRRTVQMTLRASYTNHYRRGLVALLGVLEFRSNNDRHRPVLEALDLVRRYHGSRTRFFPIDEDVPTHKGLVGDWAALVFDNTGGQPRVVRSGIRDLLRSRPCASSCGAKTSGSSERIGGGILMTTCPPISTDAGPSTTARCASRWTPLSSSMVSRPTCAPRSPRSTPSSRHWSGSTLPTVASAARSASRHSPRCPSRRTCGR